MDFYRIDPMFFTIFDNLFNLSVLRLPEPVTLAFPHFSVFRLELVWTGDTGFIACSPRQQHTACLALGRAVRYLHKTDDP